MRPVRKAIFPVAGLGTRFLPATKAMPKELLPIIDKPVIQYAVEEAIEAGCTELIFVTGRTKRAIEDHFDNNPELTAHLRRHGKTEIADSIQSIIPRGVNVIFTRQGEPLGLGHAVHCAAPIVGDEPALVLLADDYILPKPGSKSPSGQLAEAYRATGKSQISVTAVIDKYLSLYGVIEPEPTGQGVQKIMEKPGPGLAPSNLAAIGRYVITPTVMQKLAKIRPGNGGEIQFSDALDAEAGEGSLEFRIFSGRRFDCGDKVGYLSAIVHSALSNAEFSDDFREVLREALKSTEIAA